MKKYFTALILLLGFSVTQAQEVSDAIRYTQNNPNGTARFRAMSGSFGALGGDLSALNVNPAGSVVFANNFFGVSINNLNTSNKSNYFGKNTDDDKNSLSLNQIGGVFVFENNSGNSDWKKFALAVNYEKTADFDNSIFSAGTNNNSIDNYFLNNANGIEKRIIDGSTYNYDELSYREQQAYLGYLSFIIDYVNFLPNNTFYISNVPSGGKYNQTNSIQSTGYNGKLTANISGQYQDKLMIGLNLNSHFTDYSRASLFTEKNTNNTTTINLVKEIAFRNDLYTYGSGFSFQIGAIFKPIKEIRLGAAYQSPTWYTLNDELKQSISAVSGNNTGTLPIDNTDPNLTIIYEPYQLRTPGKFTSSFAYVIGKRGLISFDYSLRDYSFTSFSPKRDAFFQSLNNTINRNTRVKASEYNVGGEYKIKQFSLRAGYHFEQSPYKNSATLGNLTGYSGGIGYNFGNTKLDLAYATSKRDSNQQFFSQGLTDAAKINTTLNNITLTLGFEF
jgi:Outer membrane protein transport protein (OMPP1/FadL/TodX)